MPLMSWLLQLGLVWQSEALVWKSEKMRATSKGVCMYDLPAKFNTNLKNSTYNKPVPNAKTIPGLSPSFFGLHDTDQFSLDLIFYDRMQLEATSWLRPEECKLFYVPYFSQWETWDMDRDNGKWVDVGRDSLNWELMSHLKHMGRFRKPSGVDHFITLSRVEHNCGILLQDSSFEYMKKLGIENMMTAGDPFLTSIPYPAWFRYPKTSSPKAVETPSTVVVTSAHFKDSNCSNVSAVKELGKACEGKPWCAFNAPTKIEGCSIAGMHGQYKCSGSDKQFSFSATSDEYPMRTTNAASLGCRQGPCWLWGDCHKPVGKERTGPLAVFVGSARAEETQRINVIRHCELRPELCVFLDTGQPDLKLDNALITKMDDLLMSSVFCLNPPGDTLTRKGLFDSLLAGCIPVIFDEGSLAMYPWYFKDTNDVSIFIPVQLALMPSWYNVLDYLESIDPAVVRKKQDAIKRIAFSLQYSEDPDSNDPSRLDAFDVAIGRLLRDQ